jgi:cystathionine beta-lyase
MEYPFDELIERRDTGCVKWDEMSDANIIPLWVADMDFAVAPAIQEAIRKRAAHPVFGYTYVQDDYYEAVISWFLRRHGWTIQREWMLYTTGVVPAMSCVIKALTMPGEKVLILSPDYNCFFSSIRNNGCEVLENKLVRKNYSFEIDWNDFEIKCADEKTTVFLLCNPHNPTGRVWTRKELERMRDICHLHHVRIVSDEIHCELIMPGYHFCPMGIIDSEAIILNSPSKSFNIAGLQIANIICQDAEIRRRIDRAININEVCDVNPFAPIAVKAAYNESEEWIDELNQYLCQNYQILNLFFSKELPQCKVCKLEGTYLVWIDVSALGIPVEQLCERLLNKGKVWVNPGTMYGTESGKGYIRINIACPRNRLIEGLKRIKATI